jgi:hypothetical protein
MARETSKKREKERARREKQQKKAARRIERRNEKAKNDTDFEAERRATLALTGIKFFSCAGRARDPKKKSEITLYTIRKVEARSDAEATRKGV